MTAILNKKIKRKNGMPHVAIIELRNLTHLQKTKLFLWLLDFAHDELPTNKDLIITLCDTKRIKK